MIKSIIKITRIDNPIPILGVFIPCLWGLAWGKYYLTYKYAIQSFFFFGIASIITRSAGCIINDIADKDIDKYVKRTKDRVLATGELSVRTAFIIFILLFLIGFYMLFWLKPLAVFFAILGAILTIIYPFTKRFLKRPQMVLGAAFNMGLLVAYANSSNKISLSVVLIYIAAVYWTIFYDTIYAYQDIKDDIKLNLNSTAIVYQDNPKYYLRTLLNITMILLFIAGLVDSLSANLFYYIGIFLSIGLALRVLRYTDIDDPISCKKSFRANIILEFFILIIIYFGR